MRDGRTRKLDRVQPDASFEAQRRRQRAALVVLSGRWAGTEYELDQPKVSLGRGPGVTLPFEDSAMSREHAAIEFANGGFRVRDLGSTNGTLVNGSEIGAVELEHGDRLQLGEHVFQLVLEERPSEPLTHELADGD